MEIKLYTKEDEGPLMDMIRAEGEDWACYSAPEAEGNYKERLASSLTYVAYEDEVLCGYSRSLYDGELYIFILDLLVDRRFRGRDIGRKLMECVCRDNPSHTVYVLSGVDGYYQKLGYEREGSIFRVKV